MTLVHDSNHWCYLANNILYMPQQALVRLLIFKDERSHSDTPHSVGLLCTSDRSVAETST